VPAAAPFCDHRRPFVSWLRLPWDWLAMICGLLYWLVFGGLLTLVGGLLHLILSQSAGEKTGQSLIHWLFRSFVVYLRLSDLVRVDSRALDELADRRAAIIAPNHTSLWDVVFLIARLPRITCVMKHSILKNPVLGGGARLAGYIPNHNDRQVIRAAVEELGRGGNLLMFPEGTRTRRDARWINPLRGGCGVIATRSGAPVIPVFIRSDTRYLEKGWPLIRRPVFPIRMRLDPGEPLVPREGESSRDFTARLEQTFERELSKPHPLRRRPCRGREGEIKSP
jgi:1-acyl-sn-glycerol-3-phosphate acyltransferase